MNVHKVRGSRKPRIALVGDDPMILSVYSRVLTHRLKFSRPEVFSDGGSLLKSLFEDHQRFDIILMDYCAPEPDNLEIARAILKDRPKTTIVMTSTRDTLSEEGMKIGLSFLPKPFSIAQLSEKLGGDPKKDIESLAR